MCDGIGFQCLLTAIHAACRPGSRHRRSGRGRRGNGNALVFGGNVGNAAARGAVYGGSTGAAAGAMSGAMADSNQKKAQQAAELEALRKRLGDDAFNGLAALVECKHEVAQGYGRMAAKSDNPDFALAGLWLQVITFADSRQEDQARALLPDLVKQDSKLSSESQAETEMQAARRKTDGYPARV